MITADPNTFLGHLCAEVAAMKPGESVTVDRHLLKANVPSLFHNDTEFTPADRVLGNIVGSAYTHSYSVDPASGDVTFRRHERTGKRFSADPDQRGVDLRRGK